MSHVTHDKEAFGLETMAAQIRHWLKWHRASRSKENLVTDGDTSIMALPVTYWPSHAQFEAWIETMEHSAKRLRGQSVIPEGSLRVEAHMTNPPVPIGFHVMVDGKTVAVLSWLNVREAYGVYSNMASNIEKARREAEMKL